MKLFFATTLASAALLVLVLGFAEGVTSADDMSDSIMLYDFSAMSAKAWTEMNDPVMGGKSTGTFTVKDGVGIFDGEVVDVPSLKAPGFIQATIGRDFTHRSSPVVHFPDVSKCSGLAVKATAKYPYGGYRLSFGTKNALFCSFFSRGFKAHFSPSMEAGGTVIIPFSNFTDCNSDSTGEPLKGRTCADNKRYCPDAETLKDVGELTIWAEGVAGKVHLEIESIAAVGCGGGGGGGGDHCASTEYCCPDAKHCLTPTNVTCAKDASVCSSDETCCPLTKLCVKVGDPCSSPCKESDTYCCPDAKACLKPTHPGVLCGGASDCAHGEVCCPLTKLCVQPFEACKPTPEGFWVTTE